MIFHNITVLNSFRTYYSDNINIIRLIDKTKYLY